MNQTITIMPDTEKNLWILTEERPKI